MAGVYNEHNNAERIALKFVEYINKQDIEGPVSMMTDGLTMITNEAKPETGRELLKKGFQRYFTDFPECKIQVSKGMRSEDAIAIIAKTTGSHIALEIEVKETVIWIMNADDKLLSDWRIFSVFDH